MNGGNRDLFAEFIGTFALVFVGAGAVVVEGHTGMSHLGMPDGKVGLLGIALAHGLTLAAMIFAVGSVSGAHFNPAVSLAAWIRGDLDGDRALRYVGVQFVGALVAALCLAGIFPDEVVFAKLGTPALGMRISGGQGVVVEGIITFVLTSAILLVTRADNSERAFTGAAVGGTLVALILFAGPLTGAAANPARYLGPAIVSGQMSQALVYLVGPVVGAVAAAFFLTAFDPRAAGATDETDETDRRNRERGVSAPARRHRDPSTGTSTGRRRTDEAAQSLVRRAYELFRAGQPQGAVATVIPLLAGIETHEPNVADSVRTLLVVVEDEHGPMPALDPYRGFLARGRMPRAAPEGLT